MKHFQSALVLLFLLLIPPTAASSPPEWVHAFQKGNLISPSAYLGVGWAAFEDNKPSYKCRQLSKDRAIDDLARQLSVMIKSQLKENLAQKGEYSQAEVTSSLTITTHQVLNGIKEKGRWTDSLERYHWVLVTIDKESAERQVQQQDFVNRVLKQLENNQTGIKKGIQRLQQYNEEQNQRIDKHMHSINGMFHRIVNQVDISNKKLIEEYTGLKQKYLTVQHQWQQQKEISQHQSSQLDFLIDQNQTLTQQLTQILSVIQNDQYLALVKDDVENQRINREFTIDIVPDRENKREYVEGETVRFTVKANRDCYIKVIYISTIDDKQSEFRKNTLLFPNPHDKNNFIRGNTPTVIGRRGELEILPPFGKDLITVVASQNQFDDIDLLLNKNASDYYTYQTRSILETVRQRGVGVKEKKGVTDTCFITSRAK